MGRPDPQFNNNNNNSSNGSSSGSRPGVLKMTEVATKNICDGVSSTIAQVSYGEAPSSTAAAGGSGWWCKLKGMEYVYVLIMIASVLAIVVTVSVVFAFRGGGEGQVKYVRAPTPLLPTFPPAAPSALLPTTKAPSPAPTWAPTTAALAFLPVETQQDSLQDPQSPQSRALNWITSNPMFPTSTQISEFDSLEEWRRQQIFALVTFYFAQDAQAWQLPNHAMWLEADQSECIWYYNTDYTRDDPYGNYNYPTCTETEREFEALRFHGLSAFGTQQQQQQQQHIPPPNFPPELALISSLKSIHLNDNKFYGKFRDIPPIGSLEDLSMANNYLYGSLPWTDLSRLSNLQRLQLSSNRFTFSISGSAIGSMTSLRYLLLQQNSLSGPIPSQLGLLTKLEYIELASNSLYGSIPSQLGLLSSLEVLNLANNHLEGDIPTQISTLPNLVDFNTTNNRLLST